MDSPRSPIGNPAELRVLAPPQHPEELGRLAHYRVLGVLGRGAMGIVFEAEDTHLRRLVALKVMSPHLAQADDARARFLREARAAAALKNDNIVTIYQVGEERGIPFLAMERLSGKSLDEWLRPDRRAGVLETLSIGKQITKGLAAAHEAGLIHRDIKPSNLWLESPRWRLKILDFGLARRNVGEFTVLTQDGALVGTPAFMAPEQARGEDLDGRCDLFSFGCVLYRMVTGRLPFQGPTMLAVLAAVTSEEPAEIRSINPEVPPSLADLIHRLLAKNPADRPRSARVVFEELGAIEKQWREGTTGPTPEPDRSAEGPTVTLPPTERTAPTAPPGTRTRAAWMGLAATAVGLSVLAILVTTITRWPAVPAAKGIPTSAPSMAIDLLELVDLRRDVLQGRFLRSANSHELRVVQEGPETIRAVLSLPWSPPRSYRLRVQLRSEKGFGPTGVDLVLASGPGRFTIFLDGSPKGGPTRAWGMRYLDEQSAAHDAKFQSLLSSGVRPAEAADRVGFDRVGRIEPPLFPTDKPTWIECTVQPGVATLSIDGKLIHRWVKDLDQLHRKGLLRRESGAASEDVELGLTFAPGGNYRLMEVLLEPLEGDAGHPLGSP